MANPIQRLSIEGADTAVTGSDVETLGHTTYGLFAIAEEDGGGIEIRLEGSPDREHWAVLDDPTGGPAELDQDDFEECPDTDTHTAMLGHRVRSAYIRYIRARLVSAPNEGSVDVYVLGGAWTGRGERPTERKGPAADL